MSPCWQVIVAGELRSEVARLTALLKEAESTARGARTMGEEGSAMRQRELDEERRRRLEAEKAVKEAAIPCQPPPESWLAVGPALP